MSLLDATLRDQAAAIATGDADPGGLLEECLARIEERNPAVNAIVEIFPERSREMLDSAPDGPLKGVPIAIKDEWPLPWRAERLGSADTLVDTAPGDSGVYRALRDAGAVIVGVANMHELGSSTTGNTSVYGPARNPWDTDRCPGGSSSGSGAAVAAGLVAGAVGADGAGSIRIPAAYCGLTGLKPTFRRSAMEGHHVPSTEMIVSGPICADAADTRLLASVLFREPLEPGRPHDLKIGRISDPLWTDARPEVAERCEAALAALVEETGAEVTEVELEGLDLAAVAAVLILATEEAVSMTPQRVAALDPALGIVNRALVKYRMLTPVPLIARAKRVRAFIRDRLAGLFESVDLLAWPTLAAPAPALDNPTAELPSGLATADVSNIRLVALANLTGVPAITAPAGLAEGLPCGIQLFARWGADALLLDAAEAIERATGREHVELRAPLRAAAV